jgi:dihydroneopterin aldolase
MIQSSIRISGLRVSVIIGVHDYEKVMPQTLYVTIALQVSIQNCFASDNVDDTVDYDSLTKNLTTFMYKTRYNLLETLAFSCCQWLFDQSDRIQAVKLTLTKPNAIATADAASVIVSLNRSDLTTSV